ncbi:MAG: amino acid ABC transporter permease [Hyphomicrobiaceae bacterium]
MTLVDTFFNARVIEESLPMLRLGIGTTLLLGASCIVFGSVLGMLIALARLYAPLPVRLFAVVFADLFRSLPALIVLVLVYFALPFVGIRLSGYTSATLALSIVFAAFASEIFRAGIQAVPKGQFEAAASLGLPFWMVLRKVVLPQALKVVIPPFTSNCIEGIKATSLSAFVAMPDLLKQAFDAQALFANPTPLMVAAGIYLVIMWPLVRLVGYLEARSREATAR